MACASRSVYILHVTLFFGNPKSSFVRPVGLQPPARGHTSKATPAQIDAYSMVQNTDVGGMNKQMEGRNQRSGDIQTRQHPPKRSAPPKLHQAGERATGTTAHREDRTTPGVGGETVGTRMRQTRRRASTSLETRHTVSRTVIYMGGKHV